jgi:hypothetical protein
MFWRGKVVTTCREWDLRELRVTEELTYVANAYLLPAVIGHFIQNTS